MKLLVFCLTLAGLIGCGTMNRGVRQPYVAPTATDALGFAGQALGKGQPVEALAWLLRVGGDSAEESELKARTVAEIESIFERLLGEARYAELLNLAQGIGGSGVEVDIPPTLEVQKRLLGYFQEKGWGAPAASLILGMSQQGGQGTKEKTAWMNFLYDERNKGALRDFLARNRDLVPTAEQAEWVARASTAPDWLRGTVTVLVNKGIKIERGMGVPDIVIGSAFYIDRRGYLLTNYHIIQSEVDPEYEGFSRLSVVPSSGRGERIPARVVGWDKNLDVALIKIEREAPFVFSLLSVPEIRQGDAVLALGSPAGLESTVTAGIVSALERPFLPLGTAIQVDAPVNPGNSGGPLVTTNGKVIGMVFAGAPNFQGLNFAVAIDYIVPILPQLYAGGEVQRAWMGFGIAETAKGMEVNYLHPEGPAERAGIPKGSLVRSLNGNRVGAPADIHKALSSAHVGNLVRLGWEKGDTSGTAYIVLQRRSRNPLVDSLRVDVPAALTPHLLGMEIEGMGDPYWQNYRVRRTWANSVADQLNLSQDDPITIQNWDLNPKEEVLLVQLFVKRRMGGYLESTVRFQLPLIPFLTF